MKRPRREPPAIDMSKAIGLKTAQSRGPVSRCLLAWHGFGWLAVAAGVFGGALTQASGEIRVLISTNYYTVTGSTLPELWESMLQVRPWSTNLNFNARTDWGMEYRYTARVTREDWKWSFRSISVQTKVTVSLPRWTPPPGADPALVDAWARFQKGVGLHELGHISVARAATAALYGELSAMPAQDSAEALQEAADSTVGRILEKYRKMDNEYDQNTHHGATQGAVLRWLPGRRGPPYWALRPY